MSARACGASSTTGPPGQHSPVGWADPRVVEATRRAIAEETDRSTGTVGRLRRRVASCWPRLPPRPATPRRQLFPEGPIGPRELMRLVSELAADLANRGACPALPS